MCILVTCLHIQNQILWFVTVLLPFNKHKYYTVIKYVCKVKYLSECYNKQKQPTSLKLAKDTVCFININIKIINVTLHSNFFMKSQKFYFYLQQIKILHFIKSSDFVTQAHMILCSDFCGSKNYFKSQCTFWRINSCQNSVQRGTNSDK